VLFLDIFIKHKCYLLNNFNFKECIMGEAEKSSLIYSSFLYFYPKTLSLSLGDP